MPNWMQNAITVEGKDADKVIKQMLVKDEENQILQFDFNKLIPMPDELNIECSTRTESYIDIYLTYLNPDIKYIGKENTSYDIFDDARRTFNRNVGINKYYGETKKENIIDIIQGKSESLDRTINTKLDECLKIGEQALNNIKQHKFIDWYNWRIHHWGTKWNACETLYSEDKPCYVMFQTAWDCVPEILIALSKKFPENTFYYEFAEEEAGVYTGHATYKNGKEKDACRYEDYTKEAHDMSDKLWDGHLSFVFNDTTKTYDYIESEDDEDAEL